ncbi:MULTISPECIES: hypothetical protein [Aerococcus]|uniref:DNA-binding protein n=2 Tax=Aerococcus TaxID=1375 RepID=A0A5N1BI07_9LACT|nr:MULTISPECIES: hypothetical protein [Aerococcus]MDL5184738.1 hypothetical protein [Aerococcus mictus]KAA9238604.1 hypothetical protein F6I34_08145 [Aerococcus urinae]MDK6371963.1 hypothetical protein [Aerococcus urinae]MDK7302404.1 hypothetical protein [Aerococcus urinae]MDK7802262.1 hypothetical protein [Aerococcus urinae]
MTATIAEDLIEIKGLLEKLVTSQQRYLRPQDVRDEFFIGERTLKTWEAHGLKKIELPTQSKSRFYYDRKDIEQFMESNKY